MLCVRVVAYVMCQGSCVYFVSRTLYMFCVRVVAYVLCQGRCVYYVSG